MSDADPFDPTAPTNRRAARRRLTERQMAANERLSPYHTNMHEPVHEPLRKKEKPVADMSRWDDFDEEYEDVGVDRLRVPKDEIPDGIDYQWVTDSVLGQPAPQRRAQFEKAGWLPVPASRHDGRFMPKGYTGEINVDGLVLMERPLEFSIRARNREKNAAFGQVRAKEAQLTGGNIPGVTLDTQHESALNKNRIKKSYESFIPPDEG